MHPLVGVTVSDLPSDDGNFSYLRIPQPYPDAIWQGGGIPVLLDLNEAQAEELADRLDGLVLSGGGDADPALYGAARHAETCEISAVRDAAELSLARAFARRGKPILGICRGMQIAAVAFGGTLHQHVPDLPHVRFAHGDRATLHGVRTEPGSALRAIYGAESITVNSTHHQAVDRLPEGFAISATSEDGLIEGIEQGNILLVQWHPERAIPEVHRALFAYFIKMCKA